MQAPHSNGKTAPFTLGPREAKAAVLLLHGFTGSPWEVRPLGEALAARGYRVHAPLLPGHGGPPEGMLWATWREWLAAAEDALRALEGVERVAVSGLSMGALLATLLAARHPSRVRGLGLMAPVVQVRRGGARFLRVVRRLPLRGLLPEWVKKETTDIELDEVRAESPLMPRYPLARVLDLFSLQDLVFDSLQDVRCDSVVLASRNDRVVDFEAVADFQRRLPRSRLVTLQRGRHIIPRDADRALAITTLADFFDGVAPV
ncbi:MAG: alpha/beta fold hydrolase [Myxococcota bacterium]